ncbi:MAG: hypothetical protein ACLF0G_06580 [Candidatus Brocadiia bacterium]
MSTRFYLSVRPEALVASMLEPADFGTYLAVGTEKRSRGQALFLDLDREALGEPFDLAAADERCTPHPDGTPKHSVYLAIYRVLERVPLAALRRLWLVTRDGRVLGLDPEALPQAFPATYHLYQEICPVHPQIASTLGPVDFCRFVTDPAQAIFVPRICFVDLDLAGLADDPRHGEPTCLPYPNIQHLRDCLAQLEADPQKHTKTVDRIHPEHFPFRCVRNGFFVGDRDDVLYYPFPSRDELETKHYLWWRSANV